VATFVRHGASFEAMTAERGGQFQCGIVIHRRHSKVIFGLSQANLSSHIDGEMPVFG
jgi:hypothetical protein